MICFLLLKIAISPFISLPNKALALMKSSSAMILLLLITSSSWMRSKLVKALSILLTSSFSSTFKPVIWLLSVIISRGSINVVLPVSLTSYIAPRTFDLYVVLTGKTK